MNVLVVSPHPDDETLGCGGTILQHVADGDVVRVVFLTSGEAGWKGHDPEETARVREAEADEALSVLGVDGHEFWHEPDGRLRATRPVVERLARVLERDDVDRLYVTHTGEQHPDHRAAGRIARRAADVATAEVEVLGFEVWTPITAMHLIIDITSYVATKLRAAACYRSQNSVLDFTEAFRGLARYRGEMHSWPGGSYAEAFCEVRAPDDRGTGGGGEQ